MAYFTKKLADIGSITQKPLVQKCCEWSQKLLLGPLSTLDKSNWMCPFCLEIDTKRRAKRMEIQTPYIYQAQKRI